MKKTALIANTGLLVILGGYVLTITDIGLNGLELLLLVFAVASPAASILALLKTRAMGVALKLVMGVASIGLLTTLLVYVLDHQPLQGLELGTDWPVLLVLASMFAAAVLSILALVVRTPPQSTRSQ